MSKTNSDKRSLALVVLTIAVASLMIGSYGTSDMGVAKGQISGSTYTPKIVGMYYLNFTETGLPAGTYWRLSYGTSPGYYPSTVYSTGDRISLLVSNGSYYFNNVYASISQTNQYVAEQFSGTAIVNGHDVNVPITFANVSIPKPFFNEYFNVTNLPSVLNGISWAWTVQLSGIDIFYPPETLSSNGASIEFQNLYVGNYTYSITSPYGTSLSPASGTIMVASNGTVHLTFSLGKTYQVKFVETGLQTKMGFFVCVGNNLGFSLDNESYPGDNYVTFNLVNGTYSFITVTLFNYVGSPSSGAFTVHGASLLLNISFSLPQSTYRARFAITNPSSTIIPNTQMDFSADVYTLNGVCVGTSLSGGQIYSVVTGLQNGTYQYKIYNHINGYTLSPARGEFTIDGSNITLGLTIQPAPKTYSANFTIANPPVSIPAWQVMVMNDSTVLRSYNTYNPQYTFANLMPGIYNYSVMVCGQYGFENTTGTFTINDRNASVSLHLIQQKSYPLFFSSKGIPSGTEWGVTLTFGIPFSSSIAATCCMDLVTVPAPLEFPIYLPNGTYQFQAYILNHGTYSFLNPVTITVNGKSQNVSTDFAPSTTGNNGGAFAIDAGIAAIVIVGAGIGVTYFYRRKALPPKQK